MVSFALLLRLLAERWVELCLAGEQVPLWVFLFWRGRVPRPLATLSNARIWDRFQWVGLRDAPEVAVRDVVSTACPIVATWPRYPRRTLAPASCGG